MVFHDALVDHPLSALTKDEIVQASAIARDSGRLTGPALDVRFAHIALYEPDKSSVRAFVKGDRH